MVGSVFQALGNGVYSLLVSVVRQLLVILPVVWLAVSKASAFGRAAEIFWCDMDGQVRFVPVSPTQIFPILSEDVDETVLGACRTFMLRDGTLRVQYADSEGIYDFAEKNGDLVVLGEREHLFGCVPANFYMKYYSLL